MRPRQAKQIERFIKGQQGVINAEMVKAFILSIEYKERFGT